MTVSHTSFLVCLLIGLEDLVLSTLDVISHMVKHLFSPPFITQGIEELLSNVSNLH